MHGCSLADLTKARAENRTSGLLALHGCSLADLTKARAENRTSGLLALIARSPEVRFSARALVRSARLQPCMLHALLAFLISGFPFYSTSFIMSVPMVYNNSNEHLSNKAPHLQTSRKCPTMATKRQQTMTTTSARTIYSHIA